MTLNSEEYDLLTKIAEKSKMDCWFLIKQTKKGEDYVYDLEEGKMHVQNGITYWACSQNGTAGRRCVTHPMSEEIVERTFRNFYNKLKQHEGEILKST